jgi:hypothetical protein
MSFSVHSEVISVLTELYTTLHTLAAVPPGAFWVRTSDPDAYKSDTGEQQVFDTKAARAAGFSDEAVRLLASSPYWDHPIYIEPNTQTECHLGQNEYGFAEQRELFMGCDELLPPSAVRLTLSSSIYGTDFIYDVEKSNTTRVLTAPDQIR